jgi:magnesium transporter
MAHVLDSLLSETQELIAARNFRKLKEILSSEEPADIAELLYEFEPPARVFLFRLLPKDLAIEVFEMMEGAEREELLEHSTDEEVAVLIEEMSDDDRTALFDELPAKTVKKMLQVLSPAERKLANTLLNYPDDSAGRIMTPEYIDLKEDMTAEDAISTIRQNARSKETIYTCFVVDTRRHIRGVVELEDLIMAEGHTSVSSLMDDPMYVYTNADQEEVAQMLSRYDLHAVPVVDSEERLVGIITFDDILDILEEEATEDFERMAGIQPVEDTYMNSNIFTLARKRFMWLVICIVTEAFTSSVLKTYSYTIETVVALTFFIPLLIGTGGNAGTQASTLVIRGMTLGEIEWKDLWKVTMREILTGLMLGIALALLALGRAYMLGTGTGVALTVAFAVIAVVLLGNMAGTFLPLVARFLKMDPAIMSGPFITTIVDVFGLIVYFEIAKVVLSL